MRTLRERAGTLVDFPVMTRIRPTRSLFLPIALSLATVACAPDPAEEPTPDDTDIAADADGGAATPPAAPAEPDSSGSWDMVSSGEGDGLFFAEREGEPGRVHIFCSSGGGFHVNVASFSPVGSEERMSFGSGETVVTLVADPAGDELRGGVSGEGPVPTGLADLLTGETGVAVNYGAQNVGPFAAVPEDLARSFGTACTD